MVSSDLSPAGKPVRCRTLASVDQLCWLSRSSIHAAGDHLLEYLAHSFFRAKRENFKDRAYGLLLFGKPLGDGAVIKKTFKFRGSELFFFGSSTDKLHLGIFNTANVDPARCNIYFAPHAKALRPSIPSSSLRSTFRSNQVHKTLRNGSSL